MLLPVRFKTNYFVATLLLFVVEVLIALYAHDQIIRPYIGDMLVVILIYCFVKSFLNTPLISTAIAVLLFSYAIEILQYFNIISILGLQHSRLARVVIGTSFEWIDLIAYTVGIALVLLVEKFFAARKSLTKKHPVAIAQSASFIKKN